MPNGIRMILTAGYAELIHEFLPHFFSVDENAMREAVLHSQCEPVDPAVH